MRIIHSSDFHLRAEHLDRAESIVKRLKETLRTINTERQIDLIIFSGDMIDKAGKDFSDPKVQAGFTLKFWRALKKGDIELAMQEMQTYMAGLPYVEGFKKKLEEATTKEGFYEYTMYLIFSMLNVYVKTQVRCAGGRTDMVVWMPDTTYVFELKVNGTAQEALEQIDSKSYALPYRSEGKRVVKVGVSFDAETRTPVNWKVGY